MSSAASRPVLETRDLSIHYGTTIALHGLDIAVDAGDLIAVVGRNGAGKSSLLSALAGVYPFHGEAVWTVPADRVAYVPQRAHPRWEMPLDVRQVVACGRLRGRRWWDRPRQDDWRIVDDAITRLGLTDLAHRSVRTLSGGQAQRVLLARALAQRPAVLLLDEPYDGLDKTHVAILNDVLTELADSGVAVIAAVHELTIVRSVFRRVVALDGRLLADGSPDQVFSPAGLNLLFGIGSAA